MTSDTLRIIDANFNRSREALRVMEEYVRFVLDDRAGTERLKALRHDVTGAVQAMAPQDRLLAARDTPGDVGTEWTADAERSREDPLAVFTAAAARLGESLRVLEEYGKIVNPEAAARIEACRYQSYELGRRLAFVGVRHRRLREARIYVLVTASLCRHPWQETVERVAGAGADIIQLREKQLEDGELLRRAAVAADLCRQHGTLFILNDRPDVARLAGADGVHVGQTDLPVAAVRRIVGPELLIGRSTHTAQQFDMALADPPDYVAVGPMFGSVTKPQDHVAGPPLLALGAGRTELPIVAIGGITSENVRELRADRPFCVAVCGAVIGDIDPAVAVRRLRELVSGPR